MPAAAAVKADFVPAPQGSFGATLYNYTLLSAVAYADNFRGGRQSFVTIV